MKSLEEIMAFQDKNVLMRFTAAHPEFPKEETFLNTLFDDLKRFLWLYAQVDEERKKNPETELPDIGITESMLVLDEIWHEFVLLTLSYTQFCEKYFGKYLHHPPILPKYRKHTKTMTEEEASEIFVTEMVEITFEHFGEDVAVRWFDTYLNYQPRISEDMKADLG